MQCRYQVFLLFALIVFSTASQFALAQTPVHYWNRTSGLPGWHTGSNWTSGLPSTGDNVFFRNATNGTVYITEPTGVMNSINFNYSSNATGHVYTKFRGDPGFGLYGGIIAIGSNTNRTAFVDLERGTHRAVNTFFTAEGSRLDIRNDARVESGSFANYGTVNLKGTINSTNDIIVSGSNAKLKVDGGGGWVVTDSLKVSNNAQFETQSGFIDIGSLEIMRDNNSNGNGQVNVLGGNWQIDSVSIEDGRLNFQSGIFKATESMRLSRTAEVEVGAGRLMQILGGINLGYASSLSPATHATFTGPGEIFSPGGTSLFQSSSLTITNGAELNTDSVWGTSNNGSHRRITIDGVGSELSTSDIEIGNYGGMSFDVINGGTVNSHFVKLRDGLFGSAGAIATVSGAGSTWHNSGNFYVGFGDSNTQKANLIIQSEGEVTAGYMRIGDPTGSANKGEVHLLSGGKLNVLQRLDINTGGSLNFDGGTAHLGGLKLDGGTIDQSSGFITIDSGVYDIGSSTQSLIGSDSGDVFGVSFINGASMDTGSITLDVGHSGSGTLNILSGSDVNSGASVLARNGGSSASVTVDGFGSSWNNSGVVIVGMQDSAELSVTGGGTLTSHRGEIGERGSGVGIVNVDGAISRWEITKVGTDFLTNGNLLIGEFGAGTLNITNGGTVSNINGAIATQGTSTGVVTVNGAGSTWNNSGNLQVGNSSGGNATLNIESSGLVMVSDTMSVGTNGTVNLAGGMLDSETIELNGAAVFSMNSGTLKVDNFIGDLSQNGGILAPGDSPGLTTIDGDYNFNSGVIQLELAGLLRGTEYDAIDVTGAANLNGTIELSFINGFTADVGDQFNFFDALAFSGTPTFDFSNATLASGLIWDTSNLGTDGSLFVVAVPEPSSVLIFGSVLVGVFWRRRKWAGC